MRNTSMNRFLYLFITMISAGCSSVVEPIELPNLSPKSSLQEQFEIKLQPLTFEKARELNLQEYPRLVSLPGNAFSANVVNESSIMRKQFPPNLEKSIYKIGIGDEITLIQSVESAPSLGALGTGLGAGGSALLESSDNNDYQQTQTLMTSDPRVSQFISTRGRVANDGSLLLIGVGRLEAEGQHISDLRDQVRTILIRNGKPPNFQLEIREFNSQKAFITLDNNSDTTNFNNVLPITDNGTTLRHLLASVKIALDGQVLTVVKLQREGKTYSFTLNDCLSDNAPEIYLRDKDHIFISQLKYLPGKVFLVGGVTPTVLKIEPENRQSLAEALFSKGGPLEEVTAQRSAIYLLRGYNPVYAYHLDAQNPTRLLVADTVELRPNDIVFVAEQPLNIFNRVLATILPLRVFSRDAKNDNLP